MKHNKKYFFHNICLNSGEKLQMKFMTEPKYKTMSEW